MENKTEVKNFNLDEKNKNNDLNINFTIFSENRTFFVETKYPNYMKYTEINYKNDFIKLIKETLEQKYGNKLQNFFKYKSKDWLYHIRASFSITDHFLSNYYDDRNLENFFNETKIDKEEFYNISYNIYKWWLFHIYCDKKTCIMESSKLMEDLIEYFDNKINNKTNELKMVIDSGHDVTVGPMQLFMYKAFDVDYTVCAFACNIYFELHKKINKENKEKYYVRYYVDDDLRLNIIYEEFKKNVLNNVWSQTDKEQFCRGNILKVLHPRLVLSIYIILFIGFIVICSFVIHKYYGIYYKNERKNSMIDNNNDEKLINKKDKINDKKKKFEELNNEDAKEMEIIK